MRRSRLVSVGVVVLAVLGGLAYFAFSVPGIPAAEQVKLAKQDELVKQGEYLARLGDCAACHTAPG